VKARMALVIAIVLGFAAAIGFTVLLQRKRGEIEKRFQTVTVLTAVRALKPGRKIRYADIGEAEVTRASTTYDTLTPRDLPRIEGRTVQMPITKDEPLRSRHFQERRASPDVTKSERFQPGYRLFTLSVNQEAGCHHQILPGSYIDILGTFMIPGQRAGQEQVSISRYVVRRVRVISVDNLTAENVAAKETATRGYATVSLAVTPEEALLLHHARSVSQGGLTLLLRRADDLPMGSEAQPTPPVSLVTLQQRLDREDQERRKREAEMKVETER
jgi:Flp pilus assembly protein CpaB